jgi:hypothetical protein
MHNATFVRPLAVFVPIHCHGRHQRQNNRHQWNIDEFLSGNRQA